MCEEFNMDIGKVICKFDVYICDLGETVSEFADTGMLTKKRPCVIVSSDDLNNPRNGQYKIAPIRTEHYHSEVNRENLEMIIAEKRKLGRIYVPIEMNKEDFRFIDLTQTRPISIRKIQHYVGTILNSELRRRINRDLLETSYTKDELQELLESMKIQSKEIISEITTEHVPVENKLEVVEINTTDKTIEYINKQETIIKEEFDEDIKKKFYQVKNGACKLDAAANSLGINLNKFAHMYISYLENVSTHKGGRKAKEIPSDFYLFYDAYKDGTMTIQEIAQSFKISNAVTRTMLNKCETQRMIEHTYCTK